MAEGSLQRGRLLRFRDLRERGICGNWPMMRRLIERHGFPPGIRLGTQMRAWREDEVEAWIDSRRIPTDEVRS
jgi:predicted DNA-binding transcriptional regulator AlpA